MSPDGRHVGYLASGKADDSLRLFIDGKPGPALDFEELVAQSMKRPREARTLEVDVGALRARVLAELRLLHP